VVRRADAIVVGAGPNGLMAAIEPASPTGAATLGQTVFRAAPRWNSHRTALRRVYLCSAATPPGGGVHGMCGLGAARAGAGRHGAGAATVSG
jgi:phytoene dehydrogenase-like protein